MTNSSFPTLLNKKAKVIFNFNRLDMAFVGGGFLLSSFFKINAIVSLILNIVVLVLSKIIQSNVPKGYFRYLFGPKFHDWNYKLGEIDE